MRLIDTIRNNRTNQAAKVYRDSEWNEYRVRFYQDGHVQPAQDYHTDDKQDALDTARRVQAQEPAFA